MLAPQLAATSRIKAVAATADTAYYISHDGPTSFSTELFGAPLAGGATVDLGFAGAAQRLVTEGDQLYYVAGSTFNRGTETLFKGPDGVDYLEMALDATSYYILVRTPAPNGSITSIARAPRSGGDPTTLVTLDWYGFPRSFAVDDKAAYVLLDDSGPSVIVRAPFDGSSVTKVAADILPVGVAVDATSLYYLRQSPDKVDAELVRADKTGGAATVLLSSLQTPGGLLVEDEIYVLEGGGAMEAGRVQRISKQGDCGQVLATSQPIEPDLYAYSQLASSATDVFWATTAGVGRATK